MAGNQTATLKSVSAEMGVLYEWPQHSSLVLLDFAETVLWRHRMTEKAAQQKKAVQAAAKALKRQFQGSPREYRDIRYRADDGNMRSLGEDIEQCTKWLQAERAQQTPRPRKPDHRIIWNLAPFFRRKLSDPIGWRNLVKFLNCVSSSWRLAGNRKSVNGRRAQQTDARSVVTSQAKRMEAIYKRIPSDTPRDVKIQRVLNRHFRHRSDSPNKALHDRAFQALNRLIS